MAGFMSGFGSSFSKSFELASAARDAKEQDVFRLQYQDYISQRDKRQEWKREDAKRWSTAETLAKTYSTPENAPIIADMLLGQTADQVAKYLQENEISITSGANIPQPDGSGMADPRDGLTEQAGSAVNSQMSQSGMMPPQDGGIFNKQFGSQSPEQAPRMPGVDDQSERVAEVAQVSPEEVQKTRAMEGYEPVPNAKELAWTAKKKAVAPDPPSPWEVNGPEDAATYRIWAAEFGTPQDQYRAQKLVEYHEEVARRKSRRTKEEQGNLYEPTRARVENPDGTFDIAHADYDAKGGIVWTVPGKGPAKGVIKPFTQPMEKEADEIFDKVAPLSDELNTGISDLKQNIKVVNDISNLQKSFPDAATGAGTIAQAADKFVRGAYGTVNTFTNNMLRQAEQSGQNEVPYDARFAATINAAESELEAALGGVADNVNKTAIAAALIDIKATKLAYAMAASVGQTGRAVSVQEFQAQKAAALGNGNPESAQINASDFILSEMARLNDAGQNILKNNTRVKGFKDQYGVDLPLPVPVSVEQALREDKATSDALDIILDKNKNNVLTQTPQGGSNMSEEDNARMQKYGIPPDVWEAMPPEDRDLFK